MSNVYQRFLFPILKHSDAETAHDGTIAALARAQAVGPGRAILRQIAGRVPHKPRKLFGLEFPNVLGVAAGFDKEGEVAEGLALLGFGHIEVGTITPQPQEGNPRPRIFRLPEDQAIINRMGFPSSGMEAAAGRLRSLARIPRSYVVGVSLGKQKETPLILAANDYVQVMKAVFPYADYLAINVSSPNTPELRRLQSRAYLSDLLGALASENKRLAAEQHIKPRPLLVKIAPDLHNTELNDILQAALDNELSGIIATNTTVSRPALNSELKEESGGLSGKPLGDRSLQVIDLIARETGGSLPIMGVGGIATADDVRARLDAGASLVQLYTALIYEGPGLAGRILRELAADQPQAQV
ncbi:MAG: quinone-dependent dihydroorotate dehydrogenase [Candidatus Promineifilaceae bacterium]